MESKKINQLATSVSPSTSDLAIIGDPITGVSKKITWLQVSTLIGTAANLQQVTDNGATTTNSVAIGGLTITGLSTGVLKSTSGVISSVPFGAANGVATLAGDGKVPSSQLPSYVDDVVEVANYAALPATGETGKIYVTLDNNKVYRWSGSIYIEIAANNAIWGAITGTLSNQTDLQNALNAKVPTSRTIAINGTSYDLSADRTWSVGTLTSVGLTMPSGFSVASSPLTGAGGTIAVTGAGASTQYIDGTGALQTFPTLLSSDNLVKLVRNQSGATMTAGTIVYISGATGNKPLIAKALATGDSTSAQTYGLLQADIANNADGYVVVIGNVGSLDTSALTEGQQLYLSGTTAVAYTTTKPYAPTHLVYIGIVLRSHPVSGIIGVKIQNGYEMDELHNVDAQSPSNNDILSYNTSTSLWEHKQIATTLGYTPISLSSLSATSPLSYNNGTGAFTIQVATASQNGYLSSTDWSTFNNKQAALGGTGFVKITGSTISYDNSTYYLASNPSAFITLASLSAGTGISYSNTTGVISSTITQYTDALARAAISSSATGLTYTSATGVFSLTAGYSIPTTAKQTEWDTAYTNRITSLTTTGSSGASTLVANTLNVPNYTLSGLGGVPTSRTLTINGTAYDLTADRTWTIAAYTLPISSSSILGGVKVGSGLSINATTGILDATYSYSLPISTSSVLGGVKIGSGVSVDAGGIISVSTNYQAPLSGTGFIKAVGSTISYDNSTYLTTTDASTTYLPLIGGTLSGNLLLTKAEQPNVLVNATNTDSYSYFGNKENGVLKTYFLYLNSLWSEVDRRETLEIRNQVGQITFYSAATLALTIDTNQYSTFAKNVSISNGLLNVYNGGAGESFIVNAGSTGNAIGVRTRTGNDYAFFNWRSIDGSELLAESYIQRTAASTATLRHTINNGSSPAIYQIISSTGTITFNSLSGTGTRMVVADANGLLSTQVITSNVTGSGTNNKVAKFTSTGSVIGDSIITATANEVTITSTLIGAMFVLDNSASPSYYSQMQFKGDTKHAYIFKGNSTYTSYGGANALNFYTDSVGGGGFAFHPAAITNAVFIDNNGNLGIGVGTSVGAKLDISGGNAIIANNNNGASTWQIRNSNAGTGAYTSLQLGNDTNNNKGGIAMLGSGYTTTGVYYANGIYLYTSGTGGVTISAESSTGVINFATNLNLKARFNKDGYLGINEATPTNLLHLAGVSATPSLRLASTSTGYYWDIGRENATTGDFLFNYTNNGTFAGTFARITTAGLFGIGVTPTSPLHVSGSSGYIANFTNGTNSIKIYCGSTYSILEGNSGNQMGWLGSGFYIEAGTTPVNRFNISAAGLTTITGELTLTGSSTHMNIVSDTSYAYTRYQGGANDMYLLQNLPTLTNNGVSAGAAYFYMSNSQQFEFNWSGVSKIQFTSTGKATFNDTILMGTTSENGFGSSVKSIQINGVAGSLLETRYNGTSGVRFGSGSDHSYHHDPRNVEMRFATSDTTRFYIYGNGNYSFTGSNVSDRRAKDNISILDITATDKIMSLEAKSYNMKNNPSQKRYGFIAQEVKQIVSDLVSGNENDGYLGLDYDGLLTLTIKALQEQQKEIQILKQK